MPKKKNQHVVPHKDGWAVKGGNNSKATVVKTTQKEAIAAAETIAKNQKSDTKVHGRDGKSEPATVMATTLIRQKTRSEGGRHDSYRYVSRAA